MKKFSFTYDKNRVTSFCDAVFSIAMTLLILEIEVPNSETLAATNFSSILTNRIPSFIGFFVSFMVIAIYWISHLRIFRYVGEVDEKLIWINIFLLLFVIFLPFTTAMYVGDFYGTASFIFYCFNLILLGLLNFLLIRYISHKELNKNGMTRTIGNWLKFRSLNAVIIWSVAAILASFLPWISRIIFILIFVFQAFGDKFYKKRL